MHAYQILVPSTIKQFSIILNILLEPVQRLESKNLIHILKSSFPTIGCNIFSCL